MQNRSNEFLMTLSLRGDDSLANIIWQILICTSAAAAGFELYDLVFDALIK